MAWDLLVIQRLENGSPLGRLDTDEVDAEELGQHPAPECVLDGTRSLAQLTSQLSELLGVLSDTGVVVGVHLLKLELQFLQLGMGFGKLLLGHGELELGFGVEGFQAAGSSHGLLQVLELAVGVLFSGLEVCFKGLLLPGQGFDILLGECCFLSSCVQRVLSSITSLGFEVVVKVYLGDHELFNVALEVLNHDPLVNVLLDEIVVPRHLSLCPLALESSLVRLQLLILGTRGLDVGEERPVLLLKVEDCRTRGLELGFQFGNLCLGLLLLAGFRQLRVEFGTEGGVHGDEAKGRNDEEGKVVVVRGRRSRSRKFKAERVRERQYSRDRTAGGGERDGESGRSEKMAVDGRKSGCGDGRRAKLLETWAGGS